MSAKKKSPEASRAYYLANRDKIIEYQKQRRQAKKAQIARGEKTYREANREKRNAQKREHYRKNRERLLVEKKAYREQQDQDAVREYKRQHYLANKGRYVARSQAWMEANQERYREWRKAYSQANAEATRLRGEQWKKDNPERYAERRREYKRQHPERVAAWSSQRRARKTTGADLTADQWMHICEAFDGHCAYCGRDDLPLQLEHMTPLSRGGRHTASNVVPACAPCNLQKYTKTAEEFAGWTTHPLAS